MTFNSLLYFLFLPVVYLLFVVSAERWRWLVLLAASYAFYASFQAYYLLAVLGLVTGISYLCGLRIAACREESRRLRWLWAGCVACVALLAGIKYFPFFAAQAAGALGVKNALSPAVIGIGVSYFSFQAISYLVDIYFEVQEPEAHLGRYALYLAFFPKLLQGPIERAEDLLPQLTKAYRFDYDAMRSGMLLFTWGLFKKVVLADRLALYADQVYGNVQGHTGLALVLGTYAYAFQIYFDFAGYTDMARGSARLFGLELTENFRSPYLASTVADFWRRWHISFSRWILDYIFRPLQMRWRGLGPAGTAAALLAAFLVSGVWHGATWGFVAWGALHGCYLAASTIYRPYQKKLHQRLGVEKSAWLKWWQVGVTFNLVNLAWVFFRARSLSDAWYVASHWMAGTKGLRELVLSQGNYELLFLATTLCSYAVLNRCISSETGVSARGAWCRWSVYMYLAACCQIFYVSKDSFIYFGF